MNAIAKILVAPEPEYIFPEPTVDSIKKTFAELAMLCHPDHVPGVEANAAFVQLRQLRDSALDKVSKGIWDIPGLLKIKATNGRRIEARYKKKTPFDLGTSYVGERVVLLSVEKTFGDLYGRGVKAISTFPKYGDDNMKKQFSRFIPQVRDNINLEDGGYMLCMTKQPDTYPLRDVLNHFGGKLDPRHVAWCVSRLLDLSCWLSYCEVSHYGLTLDNLYVSPKHHTIFLMNGWWYAHITNSNLVAVPKVVRSHCGPDIFADKRANPRVNQTMARVIGRELCGDITGAKMLHDQDIPLPMRNFLFHPASDDPVADLVRWKAILRECFGPPKYLEMVVSADKLYGKGQS